MDEADATLVKSDEIPSGLQLDEHVDDDKNNINKPKSSGGKVRRIGGRRGRKPSKIDQKAKLERSRQSARECRARKKQKYLYLEETVANKERAICALREELDMYKQWCKEMDKGVIPSEIEEALKIAKKSNETSDSDPSTSMSDMDRETQD